MLILIGIFGLFLLLLICVYLGRCAYYLKLIYNKN